MYLKQQSSWSEASLGTKGYTPVLGCTPWALQDCSDGGCNIEILNNQFEFVLANLFFLKVLLLLLLLFYFKDKTKPRSNWKKKRDQETTK